MEQETMVLLAVVGFAGLLIGLLIGKTIGGTNSSSTKKVEQEFQEYKKQVSEHFGKTADLVDNLTHSYKDVFDHLGNSARALLSEEEVQKHLQSRAEKAVTLTYMQEPQTVEEVAPEKVEEATETATDTDKDIAEQSEKVENVSEDNAEDNSEDKAESPKEKLQSELEKIADKVEATEANKK